METLNKIQNYIVNNDIENAYKYIIENEKKYISNYIYWNLRGMLCFKIGEYDIAITCYKKSININENNLDAYFNLVYIYILIGEKIKSVLYSAIALRYTDDIDFINDINSLYNEERLSEQYKDLLEDIKSNLSINCNNFSLFRYIASKFNNIDEEFIKLGDRSNIDENWLYIQDNYAISNKEILIIDDYINKQNDLNLKVIVPYNKDYISIIKDIASKGIKECNIAVPTNNSKLVLVNINKEEMHSLKNKDNEITVTLNLFNAADANVYAMIKYMPEKYKNKYKLNVINGRDVFNIDNLVKVPLLSSVTVSGFNTFTSYPKYIYNIDVGHASVIMKNCGILDKKHKNFGFTPKEYESIDKVCITSEMNMLIQSAFSAIPENKYEITGNPRTDILMLSDGRKNLEKLLDRDLKDKKIIFNMPTFHVHENSGVINGEPINEGIKIKNFNYAKFDKLLGEHNTILISKVHHAEERLITSKMKGYKLKNILFVSNNDLEEKNLNLYEVLNCADILITDYSSIYGDFLFMDKQIIFTNYDIEQYRAERGLSLEPYDFWTAGPKVKTQEQLESEVVKCLYDENYYKEKRHELRDVFYKYKDSNSTLRVWNHIDKVLSNKEN
nr:CDP-glycerol glycerophosphotransferase family protein [uncultured Romboutsia sp.]